MPELDGQIGLVTGGGRGIGADVVRDAVLDGVASAEDVGDWPRFPLP